MVGLAADVLVDQSMHRRAVEYTVLDEARLGEQVTDKGRQVGAHPQRQREAEALLFAVDQFARQVTPRHDLENVLQVATLQLHVAGDRGGELHHLVVHERWPALDRVRHRHAIDNGQQMIRHARVEVGIEHAVDDVVYAVGVEPAEDLADGIVVGDPRPGGLGEQLFLQRRREAQEAHRLGVALAGVVEGHLVDPIELRREALVAKRLGHQSEEPAHHLTPQPLWQQAVHVHHALAGEAIVAGEVLVAAVAREHHLDLLGGHLGNKIDADAERIRGLVEVPDHRRHQVNQVGLDDALVALEAVLLVHHAGIRQLVERLLFDADRERRETLA